MKSPADMISKQDIEARLNASHGLLCPRPSLTETHSRYEDTSRNLVRRSLFRSIRS